MRRFSQGAPFAIALSCLIVAGLGAVPATASTFIALDMESLVARSDTVVQGEILELNSYWEDDGRVIVTDALVAVEETIAGESAGQVWVRTFGGQVGDYHVEAIGFPRFAVGERVVLFLNHRHGVDESIRVTGYQQGHYRIVEKDGVELAVPALEEGINLVPNQGQVITAPEVLRLDALKTEVDRLARRLAGLAN